jgi:hypothetical protein
VVVLLVLAAVTDQTARALSANIDRQALADLDQTDPLEVCINGAEILTGWTQSQGPLLLLPFFKWPNGTSLPLLPILAPSDFPDIGKGDFL